MGRNPEKRKKWRKDNLTTPLGIRLNKVTDADVIERLNEQENKRAYILQLIRDDISRNK